MLLREVEYARPASVQEAVRLLSEHEEARPLAGGQTLINVMKARAASPDMLVDLQELDELKGIELGATMTIAGANGERQVPAEEFFPGVYMTAVGPGELLTKISVPPGRADGFAAVTIGKDGTCIVNAAASLNGGGPRIAIGCVDAVPVLVRPQSADADAVGAAVRDANFDPPNDVHASADYRRHLAEVLAVRAVQQAQERKH